MLSILAALALAAPHAHSAAAGHRHARPHCSFRNIRACTDTLELRRDPNFERAVAAFAGGARGHYLGIGSLVSEQVIIGLSSSEDPVDLGGGVLRFNGWVQHDAQERGAAILAPGKILALGLIHYNGLKSPMTRSLDIWVRRSNSDNGRYIAALRKWGDYEVERDRKLAEHWRLPILPADPLRSVHVHMLPEAPRRGARRLRP